ncbi:hypothetical protein EGW08_021911 [Elysia chlorotica]|uniref:CUB domain-containing protein n=1 Tax=Elysia chlorotica TaxID=188477 RepID=A0A3S0ZLR7_ELYCH|nr:hypothetical protein EGW08_021911 [Elysia chlorotica]
MDDRYSLVAPPVYHVLAGDLRVNYSRPSDVILPHAFVRLEYWSKTRRQSVEVQSLGLAMDRSSGQLIFACGVLEIAGSYSLRMFAHRGGTMLAQASLDVRWPDVTLSLPSELTALTSAAELHVTSAATCSAKREQFEFRVRLYHRRGKTSRSLATGSGSEDIEDSPSMGEDGVSTSDVEDPWREAEVVSEMRFPSINENATTISLGCHLFDLDGLYRAVLVSTSPDAPPVSASRALSVSWGHGYQLSVLRDSVFPCDTPLTVLYSHPPCAGANDRIRFYSRTRTVAGSPAAPLDRKYVKEVKADLDASKMELDCDLFSKAASGFCLTYVSVTRGNVFTKQTENCFPAYPNSVFPIAGSWGQWTSWGACSVTCGADMLPRTPLHTPVLEPSCPCGCHKAGDQGQIIATGRCQGFSHWTLTVEDGQEIILHFDYFHLNYSQQWVKIRDGKSPNDRLLFSSFDPGYPMEVVTSGPAARIEFMTSAVTPSKGHGPVAYRDVSAKASLPIHINGFIASYRSSAGPTTTTGPMLYQYREKPAMHSGVTIAGIAICAAAIVVVIVFVIVQRFTAKGRRAKYSMAASVSTDSPAQKDDSGRGGEAGFNDSPAHRTNSSVQSSSPSSQGNAINVDMEVPLTGKLKRKAGVGHGVNTDDTQEQNAKDKSSSDLSKSGHHKKKKKKKLMVRIDMNPVALRSSGSGDASANAGAISSQGLQVIDTDEISKQGENVPASPKVNITLPSPPNNHRHPHHHRHRRHRDKPEAPPTKFDLLRKLRQARGSEDSAGGGDKNDQSRSSKSANTVPSDLERDVTGSSGSRSPVSVATTKAEVNWPRPSDDGGGVGGAANFMRAALNEVVGRTFATSSSLSSDRHKRSAASGLGYHPHPHRRPPSEEIPLMDSMTSSLDSPSHFNAMVKSESQDSATTSFVNRGDGLPPARRPTSLTASYNSTVSNEGSSPVTDLQQHLRHVNKPGIGSGTASTVIPRPSKPSPSTLTPSSTFIPPPPSASEIKSHSLNTNQELSKKSLPKLKPYPHPSASSKSNTKLHQVSKPVCESSQPSSKTPQTPTPTQPLLDERLSSLPKPDGQSPKPYKRESPGPSTPCSKTLTRTANPPGSHANTSKSEPSREGNMTPISINTSISGPENSSRTNPASLPSDAASSPRNLAIPPHLQSKKSPEGFEDLAQARHSPVRLSGKNTPTGQGPPSPGKLSKGSSRASRGNLSSSMASPARSIPSEVDGLELEYDDFVEDDPLSYFDYEETVKLTFRGKESIGKSPVEEEEEDEEEVGEGTKLKL